MQHLRREVCAAQLGGLRAAGRGLQVAREDLRRPRRGRGLGRGCCKTSLEVAHAVVLARIEQRRPIRLGQEHDGVVEAVRAQVGGREAQLRADAAFGQPVRRVAELRQHAQERFRPGAADLAQPSRKHLAHDHRAVAAQQLHAARQHVRLGPFHIQLDQAHAALDGDVVEPGDAHRLAPRVRRRFARRREEAVAGVRLGREPREIRFARGGAERRGMQRAACGQSVLGDVARQPGEQVRARFERVHMASGAGGLGEAHREPADVRAHVQDRVARPNQRQHERGLRRLPRAAQHAGRDAGIVQVGPEGRAVGELRLHPQRLRAQPPPGRGPSRTRPSRAACGRAPRTSAAGRCSSIACSLSGSRPSTARYAAMTSARLSIPRALLRRRAFLQAGGRVAQASAGV